MPIFTLHIGDISLSPTWYGLMYVLGFFVSYIFLARVVAWRAKSDLDTLIVYAFFGVLFGGRMGYVILYNPAYFLAHPIEIFAVWHGGMSFHGGFIGVTLAVLFFAYFKKYSFWYIIDRIAVIIPIALGFGRIGNWVNRELPGYAPYDGPLAMMIDGVGHFPNPLLEAALEGIILSIVLMSCYYFTTWKKIPGRLSGIFLLGYSTARLIAEQFRLPDAHIGYLFGTGYITLGMLYTLPLFLFGISLILRKNPLN